MIKFADDDSRPLARALWKNIFGDTDEYLDMAFSSKLNNENILLYFYDNQPVASLQMFPYSMRFYGEVIDFYYLGGLCTLPDYRNRGFMRELILHSFEVMANRNIPLAILIPAEESLFSYYKKFGFEKTFEKDNNKIDLKHIIAAYTLNTKKGFDLFDNEYQQSDFTVLKSELDFRFIVEDYVRNNYSYKSNLNGMSRIIDPQFLLNLYARKNPSFNFALKFNDEIMNKHVTFLIKDGSVELTDIDCSDHEVNENQLTQLLFGFNISENDSPPIKYFKPHKTTINLMLE